MTSSMRARERITRLVGRTMPAASASRKSLRPCSRYPSVWRCAAFSAGRVARDAVRGTLAGLLLAAAGLRPPCAPLPGAWWPSHPATWLDDALLERLEDELDERPDDPRDAVLRPRELADELREPDDVLRELDEPPDGPDLRAAPLLLEELLRGWGICYPLPTRCLADASSAHYR